MIIQIVCDSAALMAKLAGYPARLRERTLATMTRLSILLQSNVKSDKLSGQVLHVRTGTLRRSINREVATTGDGNVVATVGTNVKYGAVHEYGFAGTVTVPAHVRRNRGQLKQALRERKDGSRYYTLKGLRQGTVEVRAHSMKMNVPERSFLRSALRDMQGQIAEELKDAAVKAWKE